jgi:hypothetical protein
MTPPGGRNEWMVGYIVNLRGGVAGKTALLGMYSRSPAGKSLLIVDSLRDSSTGPPTLYGPPPSTRAAGSS